MVRFSLKKKFSFFFTFLTKQIAISDDKQLMAICISNGTFVNKQMWRLDELANLKLLLITTRNRCDKFYDHIAEFTLTEQWDTTLCACVCVCVCVCDYEKSADVKDYF